MQRFIKYLFNCWSINQRLIAIIFTFIFFSCDQSNSPGLADNQFNFFDATVRFVYKTDKKIFPKNFFV